MNRAGHQEAKFFIGTEVEHTPALGLSTMFIVGLHPTEEINEYLNNNPYNIEHLYFGANQSFPNPATNDSHTWNSWEDMIGPFLKSGIACTLDIDSSAVEGLVESTLVEYQNFIPMISVKIPYAKLLGYNTTIKIDDRDFAATNPGVWCHSLHTLQNREVFTPGSRYTKDEIVK